MKTSRRVFIRNFSLSSAWLLSGGVQALSAAELNARRGKVKLRLAIASDGHFGQKGTKFHEDFERIVNHINAFHRQFAIDACVINGDLIHNNKEFLPQTKTYFDKLETPYYVTRGNHDMVSTDYWQQVWNAPVNQVVIHKNTALVLADTSNEKGEYLCPDLKWLKQVLDEQANKKQVFLFLHIPQAKWTNNAIDSPAFFELIKNYPNIKAVFHGHEHDKDDVFMHEGIPYLFDAHFGGNWGTDYKGFRVVELMKDGSVVTYIMNPVEKIKEHHY